MFDSVVYFMKQCPWKDRANASWGGGKRSLAILRKSLFMNFALICASMTSTLVVDNYLMKIKL